MRQDAVVNETVVSKLIRRFLLMLAICGLSACASYETYQESRKLVEQGQVEEGIEMARQASEENPGNEEYRVYYERTRDVYVNELLVEADKARTLGRLADAASGYNRVLGIDSENRRATAGLEAVATEEVHRREVERALALLDEGKSDEALAIAKSVLSENPSQRGAQELERRIEEANIRSSAAVPQLNESFRQPVTIEFRDAPLKSIFEVLSKSSGINFIFDRDVRPDLRATVYLRDTTIEDAVNFLLVTNQLEKRVLSENTLLIYPNLPNKNKDYRDLVVKSFYLGNADIKQTLNLIKTMVKTRDVYVDERLNLLVMRDTPSAVRLAERLIAAQDLAVPEVVLELEVLEVTRSKLQELGLRYASSLAYGLEGSEGVGGEFTLTEWLNNPRSSLVRINVTDPAFVVNLRRQDGDTNFLATPRVRVLNREKARIHIGERLPVITTTSTANVGVSESVQYLDTGLKLDIEPNVYLDDEVALKVTLEVSNVVQEVRSAQGTLTYQLGTRNTATVLRVGNGETQVLAGLISDTDRRTADKVPGLADIPGLGRLFTNNSDNRIKTEIVLLITPYVVRNVDRPGPAMLEFASGTEANFGAAPLRLSGAASLQSSAVANVAAAPASRVEALEVETDVPPLVIDTTVPEPVPLEAEEASPSGELALAPATLLLSAPLQVQAGNEFAVALSLPPGTTGDLEVLLNYDDGLLEAVGSDEPADGLIDVRVTGTATLRFRAREGGSGAATISIVDVAGVDGDAPDVAVPAPVQINITP